MSTLAVILTVVAVVLLVGAVVIAIACAVIAGRADELLERAYEQHPPAGSVRAESAEVVPFPRRTNGGGWAC
jgi:hypothetical protein